MLGFKRRKELDVELNNINMRIDGLYEHLGRKNGVTKAEIDELRKTVAELQCQLLGDEKELDLVVNNVHFTDKWWFVLCCLLCGGVIGLFIFYFVLLIVGVF